MLPGRGYRSRAQCTAGRRRQRRPGHTRILGGIKTDGTLVERGGSTAPPSRDKARPVSRIPCPVIPPVSRYPVSHIPLSHIPYPVIPPTVSLYPVSHIPLSHIPYPFIPVSYILRILYSATILCPVSRIPQHVSHYPVSRIPLSRYARRSASRFPDPIIPYPVSRYPVSHIPVSRILYPGIPYPVSRYPVSRIPVSRIPWDTQTCIPYPLSLEGGAEYQPASGPIWASFARVP